MPEELAVSRAPDKARFYRSFPHAGEEMDLMPQKRGSTRKLDKIGRSVQFLATRWQAKQVL